MVRMVFGLRERYYEAHQENAKPSIVQCLPKKETSRWVKWGASSRSTNFIFQIDMVELWDFNWNAKIFSSVTYSTEHMIHFEEIRFYPFKCQNFAVSSLGCSMIFSLFLHLLVARDELIDQRHMTHNLWLINISHDRNIIYDCTNIRIPWQCNKLIFEITFFSRTSSRPNQFRGFFIRGYMEFFS